MPSSKSAIFFLAALAVVGPVAMTQPVNALQAMGPPPVRRAEHIHRAHKMVKKRYTPSRVVPVRRQDPPPEPGSGSTTTPSPTPTGINVLDPDPAKSSNTASSAANTPPPATTQQRATTTSSSVSSSSSSATQSSSTSTSASRSTTTTTSASSSSSSPSQSLVTSSPPIAPSTTLQDAVTQLSSTPSTGRQSTVLVTTTSVASGSASQEPDKSKDQDASFLPKGVIVGLIVAASCVVGAAAIWTIIRKWKFGASRRFEDRLEPVNWEPPATSSLPMDEHDPTTVAIARGNSLNSNAQRARTSFGSSDGTHLGGPAAGGTVAPDFPPPHDFTAGPVHLAAGPGYADLQRGPSPSPSVNYGGYGQQFSTPNPYDAYDYNSGYGGVQQPPHNGVPGPHQF